MKNHLPEQFKLSSNIRTGRGSRTPKTGSYLVLELPICCYFDSIFSFLVANISHPFSSGYDALLLLGSFFPIQLE